MTMKSLCLALSLVSVFSSAALANDRYRERPPVIVSPDLSAPWLMQLGGGSARPVVVPQRQTVRQPVYQRQQAVNVRPTRQYNGVTSQRPAGVQQVAVRPNSPAKAQIAPQFLPQIVSYQTQHPAGTIVIDTPNRFLYLVLADGKARRYGVGVGKPGFEWAGTHQVTRKAEWPSWTPPKEMITREAAKGHYLPAFMEGGPQNPMGARAMYLGSTLYRIHGTNQPWTIGSNNSSGCIRMRNEDVTDLYERVNVGTKVIVM
ncbi:L,D-transpeptidase [Rhizobium sp. CG4]|jgi:lipoprotein-anchoring transpeptidase ErfK/SrfK|uniref:L,D-transpeptidase n=1 Tax=Rhizobium/Agrobacterium group TaxID=227290 RepID=UPI002033CF1F|nr:MULTISPECIES: L,D-transpeptidase [Rhizobium/Agrobacterium group]MCM2456302.1 L,D-transpeptidase [Rhizobium sp. CG4]MCS4242093.1 lipoprotein-anchoring transpeptidase ErfK/SrfK [Rhizobium sp. BIGb0125]MDO5894596.1 L,D-transpeptidase [Agrobacterium sp. Azo12]